MKRSSKRLHLRRIGRWHYRPPEQGHGRKAHHEMVCPCDLITLIRPTQVGTESLRTPRSHR
jgi:hypothetical protein